MSVGSKYVYFRSIMLLVGGCAMAFAGCVERHWNNPLDSTNPTIWTKLIDPPEKSVQSVVQYRQFVINDRIYFLSAGSSLTMYKLLDREKGWATLAINPSGGQYIDAAVLQGKIYIVTGRFGATEYYVTSFDVTGEKFGIDVLIQVDNSQLHALVECRGDLYVIESDTVTGGKSSISKLDPANGSISIISSTARERGRFVTGVVDNDIYIIGGFEYGSVSNLTNAVESFSITNKIWKEHASLPIKSDMLASSVVEGKIYVFDGNLGGVFKFDPASNTWQTKSGHMRFLKYSSINTVADGEAILVLSLFIQQRKEYEIYLYNTLRD